MLFFADALDSILPEFKYVKPLGGMFIYGKIEGVDTFCLVKECLKQKVAFVPGSEFYLNNEIKDEIRFNFSYSKDEQIISGLKIIKSLIKKVKFRRVYLLK